VEAEEVEGPADCGGVVLQFLDCHIVNIRRDGRVLRAFEHCPELEVFTVAGGEGDAIEVCRLVKPRCDCLGQTAWPGILQRSHVEIIQPKTQSQTNETGVQGCDTAGGRYRAISAG
jgi:hypothetical protein